MIRRPSPAFVVSCISLFVALSGSAIALQGQNGVKSDDIARGAVHRGDVANNAINGAKVANNSITGDDVNETTRTGRRSPAFLRAVAAVAARRRGPPAAI